MAYVMLRTGLSGHGFLFMIGRDLGDEVRRCRIACEVVGPGVALATVPAGATPRQGR